MAGLSPNGAPDGAPGDDDDGKYCPHCFTRLDRKTAPVLPGDYFDSAQRAVIVGTDRRCLAPKAWELLLILWQRRGRVVPRDALMSLIYGGAGDEPDQKILDVYVCRLRAALRGTPYMIRTSFTEGFEFAVKGQPVDKAQVEIGAVEAGVPPPAEPRRAGSVVLDRLGQLLPGQSLVVRNSTLASLKARCRVAKKQGLGTFVAAPAHYGGIRIWRQS